MKKISLIIAFSVFCLAKMNAQIIPEGVYYIRSSINRNYVIDLNASVVQSGNNIQLWDFNGTNAQKWRVTHSNGAVVLRSAINNSYVIDLNSSNASNGANIQLWEYNGTNAQRWYAEKRGAFYVLHSAVNSHFSLDLKQSNTARGANIHLWEDNNTGAQKWIFEPVSTSTASTYTAGSVNSTNTTNSKKINERSYTIPNHIASIFQQATSPEVTERLYKKYGYLYDSEEHSSAFMHPEWTAECIIFWPTGPERNKRYIRIDFLVFGSLTDDEFCQYVKKAYEGNGWLIHRDPDGVYVADKVIDGKKYRALIEYYPSEATDRINIIEATFAQM